MVFSCLCVRLYILLSAIMLAGQPFYAERLPDMNVPRAGHNMFFVNGELTVAGGHTSGYVLTPTAEYFSNGQWHVVPLVYNHDNGMSVVMSDGQRVLLAGGHDKNLGIGQSFEVEMYNGATHTSEGFGSLEHNRAFAQGIGLSNNEVLIAGNLKGNDAFEMFDGKKSFKDVKDIKVWRSSPYLLPVANGDAICLGAVWRGRFEPCDTVERLKGEPFTEPLLKEWMPFLYTSNSHFTETCIDEYSYLTGVQNLDGDVAFIHIHDTVFSLLPTITPVPTMSEFGKIKYDRPVVVDSKAKRAYLVGNDTTNRVYVVAVDYDKRPAPLTLYISEPLPDFGDNNPILTPDGDIIIAGGINGDNFAPLASVWLLHTGTQKAMMSSFANTKISWLWVLCGLVLVIIIIVNIVKYRKRNYGEIDTLMPQIIQLMESQRLYLNKDLKVSDVANALGVHRNAVSASINAQERCTFNQFVNRYRIEHAKKLLNDTSDIKISAISLESGFANERTFFRVFKEATGTSPKDWAAKN